MDRPIHFRRNHQTTDEWYASTLDSQVRARWKAPPKDIKKRQELGNRLAGLYGANTSSKMIRRRAGKLLHENEKASFHSPASLRRSMSPKKKNKGRRSRKAGKGSPSSFAGYDNISDQDSPAKYSPNTPNTNATTPMTNASSTNVEANIGTSPSTPSGNQLGGVMMESVEDYSMYHKDQSSPERRRATATFSQKCLRNQNISVKSTRAPSLKAFMSVLARLHRFALRQRTKIRLSGDNQCVEKGSPHDDVTNWFENEEHSKTKKYADNSTFKCIHPTVHF